MVRRISCRFKFVVEFSSFFKFVATLLVTVSIYHCHLFINFHLSLLKYIFIKHKWLVEKTEVPKNCLGEIIPIFSLVKKNCVALENLKHRLIRSSFVSFLGTKGNDSDNLFYHESCARISLCPLC
jgi:hypothetical protein